MRTSRRLIRGLPLRLLLVALFIGSANQLGASPDAVSPEGDYSRKGADTCLKCHDQDAEAPVLSLFATPHGRRQDSRAPMSQRQCEACHGPGEAHAGRVRRGEERPAMPYFSRSGTARTSEENQICLACHQDGERSHWLGSEHESEDVGCVSCHQVHSRVDPMRHSSRQNARCADCHQDVRAATLRPSSHPLSSGEMRCSDCHSSHGAVQDTLLRGLEKNQACFDCHAEKRGPLLWPHDPVSEDCTQCHQAHGSTHPAMLTQRPPLLCQQCHAQPDHPSLPPDPQSLPSSRLSLRSCVNCHSQVHGSNHPSGAALMR